MKHFSAICLSLVLAIPAIAQDAHEGTIRYKQEDRNGVVATYDAPKSVTEDALQDRLKSSGLDKKHNEGGYWKYEGVVWPEISANKVDVYFDISGSKGKSVISMMISPGNGNFVSSATDPQIVEGMKAFLTRFNTDVIAWQHKLAVAAQQDVLDKAGRDMKSADREKKHADRRQRKAEHKKATSEREVAEEQKKMEELQKGK